MEIIVSARHFDVSEDLKAYVEDKVGKLGEEYAKLTTARVVLDMQRNWQVAEGHVTGKQLDMEAHASTSDMYASVDEMFDKLERQLRKHLEKIQEHRKVVPMGEAMRVELEAEEPEEEMTDELDETLDEVEEEMSVG